MLIKRFHKSSRSTKIALVTGSSLVLLGGIAKLFL